MKLLLLFNFEVKTICWVQTIENSANLFKYSFIKISKTSSIFEKWENFYSLNLNAHRNRFTLKQDIGFPIVIKMVWLCYFNKYTPFVLGV